MRPNEWSTYERVWDGSVWIERQVKRQAGGRWVTRTVTGERGSKVDIVPAETGQQLFSRAEMF